MTSVKMSKDGNYYLWHNTNSKTPHRGKHHNKRTGRDWWFVRYSYDVGGYGELVLSKVYLPKKFVGKKIKFKIEVMA